MPWSTTTEENIVGSKIRELTKGNISLISFEDETLEEGEVML
jgi:hypothetical protein